MPTHLRTPSFCALMLLTSIAADVQARTVYRCVRNGTVSLATAPEPGSRCEAKQIDDNAAKLPNLWGALGVVNGTLYEREQDGKLVYSTRNLPGSVKVLSFRVETPKGAEAHAGLGTLGPPQLDRYPVEFRAAAKATGVEDALLRSIAQVESGFDPLALSPKGAQGVMQLTPAVAKQYGVSEPFVAGPSITGGARHLKDLLRQYHNDITLVAAAYNAGVGAVAHYDGVPPYAETQDYVARVLALYPDYKAALAPPAKAHKARARKKRRKH
ncbi:lytic transglycosylase domain-containing protein [Arenimonas sp.]|uniref:lytic transglycosylase domain-containing protein n=1 Tax=Arenimonas sp. TaxID=1872635 RepID=UPI002D1F9D1C|nr:lytic transglycosylase domain-containing protein [Arenimonas sp.]